MYKELALYFDTSHKDLQNCFFVLISYNFVYCVMSGACFQATMSIK